jgi:hypothetical protein
MSVRSTKAGVAWSTRSMKAEPRRSTKVESRIARLSRDASDLVSWCLETSPRRTHAHSPSRVKSESEQCLEVGQPAHDTRVAPKSLSFDL